MVGPPTFFRGADGRAGLHARSGSRRCGLISSGGAGVSAAFVDEADGAARRAGQAHVRVDRSTDGRHRRRSRSPRPSSQLAPSGELLVRGPEVCVGYLDPARQRRRVHRRRLVPHRRPRDVRRTGRSRSSAALKDVIIRGGENISTAEVEDVLEAHPRGPARGRRRLPGRADGRAASRRSSSPTRPFDLDDARAWFAERGVAKFKTPERMLVVDELPLLATGKPDRAALRRAVVPG